MLTRKDYIALLAESPFPKDVFDKKQNTIPIEPNSISNYDFAVLNGFKWGEDFYNKSVNTYIDWLASSPVSKELYDTKNKPIVLKQPNDYQYSVLKWFKGSKKQYDAIYWKSIKEIQKENDSKPLLESLKKLSEELQETKSKIDNKELEDYSKQLTEKEQEEEKRLEAEKEKQEKEAIKSEIQKVETQTDKSIKLISLELSEEKELSNKRINDTNEKIEKVKIRVLNLENEPKPDFQSILSPLHKKIDWVEKLLDDKTDIKEVRTALDSFLTKDEVKKAYYNKLELDDKFKKIKKWDISILWRGWAPGSATWWMITWTLSNQADLQTALDLKANLASPTFTGTVTLPSTTSIGTVSDTEISYLDWATSNIQTQLNAKESTLTFSTGLTRATNTITSNLSTGVSWGQSVIGGTASGNNLTLSSTSNAAKGKIIIWTSAYDEVNNRLGIGTTTPDGEISGVVAVYTAGWHSGIYLKSSTNNAGNLNNWPGIIFGNPTPNPTANVDWSAIFSRQFGTDQDNTGLVFAVRSDSNTAARFDLMTMYFDTAASPQYRITMWVGTTATGLLTVGWNIDTTAWVRPDLGFYNSFMLTGDVNAIGAWTDAYVLLHAVWAIDTGVYNYCKGILIVQRQTSIMSDASVKIQTNTTNGGLWTGYIEVSQNDPGTLTVELVECTYGGETYAAIKFSGTMPRNGSWFTGIRNSVGNAVTEITAVNGALVSGVTVKNSISVNSNLTSISASFANYNVVKNLNIGLDTTPTARLLLPAGTATANTAPLRFTSGTSLTTAVAGAVEFTTDDLFFTITTGAARKGIVLDDGTRLTSGRVPFATTNGRLIDDADMTFATDTLTVAKVSTGTLINTGVIRLKWYTVATLPAGTQGDTAYVTDALWPTFLVPIVGGGAVVSTVFYNGTARVAQ